MYICMSLWIFKTHEKHNLLISKPSLSNRKLNSHAHGYQYVQMVNLEDSEYSLLIGIYKTVCSQNGMWCPCLEIINLSWNLVKQVYVGL